jgi:hypothetical protein
MGGHLLIKPGRLPEEGYKYPFLLGRINGSVSVPGSW